MDNVLIDTNLIIEREKNAIVQDELSDLLRCLNSSKKYRIVIHPKTIEELTRNKDENDRKVILSKVSSYSSIADPPKATQEFHELLGVGRIPNDLVDNELLYALQRGCASYLITNDIKLRKKAKKVDLLDCVFDVSSALKWFQQKELVNEYQSAAIRKRPLYQIDVNSPFFQSLIDDYDGFEEWFLKKAKEGQEAYCSFNNKGEIGSILLLKEENINELDKTIAPYFDNNKKLKIATMKVNDNGKYIGEKYVQIIFREAKTRNISQIYTTIFPSHEKLIDLMLEYGFKEICTKQTKRKNGDFCQEKVLLKDLNDDGFPNVDWTRNTFIIPIMPLYVSKLFPDSENEHQLSFEELYGGTAYSNAIKKAYICNSNNQKMKPGDIVLFYASREKQSIITIGVIDKIYSGFNNAEEILTIAKRRTVYSLEEIQTVYKDEKTKLILFKLYQILDNPISIRDLIKTHIINGFPQSITQVDTSAIRCLIEN